MKITIVTATYNSSKTIIDCINSVNAQSYQNIEQLIIDGNSNDNTIEIIKSVESRVQEIVSEYDRGIYFAMNKGIKMATGDIIGILNSDDLYIDDQVITDVADLLELTEADSLYADLYYVNAMDTSKLQRFWKSGEFTPGSFAHGWHPPHPTFFVRRQVYAKYGLFDTSFAVSADFELMLRFLEKHKVSTCYLPRPILKMRHGGHSSGSIRNIITGNINCYKAFKKNEIPVNPLYLVYRSWPKIVQYLKRGKE